MSTRKKLMSFKFDGHDRDVRFVETLTIKEGVQCDVYHFIGDQSKDLAIVTVTKGRRTPLQRILLGVTTIEGFMEGAGTLVVQNGSGDLPEQKYSFTATDSGRSVEVTIGQTMQWLADSNADLVCYEICEPSYQDGRFENLTD